jgi:hypothetical protein
MKAIEFNGDCFHANPEIFNGCDRPNPFRKDLTSEDIWEFDKIKNDVIMNRGFDLMIVWEKDYRENRGKIIEEVNKFIYG